MILGGLSRRMVAGLAICATLIYIGWIGAPYLRSIVVRDAAVTTWISVTSSLVGGYTVDVLYPGARVGDDLRIAGVMDPAADQRALARAEAELEQARERVAVQSRVVEVARKTVELRTRLAAGYAAAFQRDLDIAIAGMQSKISFMKQRLELARSELARKVQLMRSGHTSQSIVDAQNDQISEYQRTLADLETELLRMTERRRFAAEEIYLTDDGRDGGDALRNLEQARVQLGEAEGALGLLQAAADAAQRIAEATRAAYDKSHKLDILAPAGAMVWSVQSAPGVAVQPGAPIASWVDCRIMLVDVPLSDVEIALLPKGAPASVVLEGERQERHGEVLLTRGSAAVIGSADLAALAKGRRPGLGQVIVQLTPSAADIAACPIGHAAHVDFPDVGLLEVLRARLRI